MEGQKHHTSDVPACVVSCAELLEQLLSEQIPGCFPFAGTLQPGCGSRGAHMLQAFHVPTLPLLSQQTARAFDLFNERESNYKAEEITEA